MTADLWHFHQTILPSAGSFSMRVVRKQDDPERHGYVDFSERSSRIGDTMPLAMLPNQAGRLEHGAWQNSLM